MKLKDRVKKEIAMRGTLRAGYPRAVSSHWYYAVRKDNRLWAKTYSQALLDRVHGQGYLAKNIRRLGLLENPNCDRISDLDYMFLQPMNNNFTKWIEDINTMTRVLKPYRKYLPEIYFSVINRNGLHILGYPSADERKGAADIVALLQEKEEMQFRPAFWLSKNAKHTIRYADEEHVIVDGKTYSLNGFRSFLRKKGSYYVLCEKTHFSYPLTEDWNKLSYFKFYIANDNAPESQILCAVAEVFQYKDEKNARQHLIDLETGTFEYGDETIAVPHWDEMCTQLRGMAESMKQINYFSISVVATEDGFKVTNCNHNPYLPRIPFNSELNDYLLECVALKKGVKVTMKQKINAIKDSRYRKRVAKKCRKGIRPYMQKLWEEAVKSDRKWRGTTMAQKRWAWKRGFLSFRIDQYGLTEENYTQFLSDYDYHWLNRINGPYQVWINDKTTFRYAMDPLKDYVPDYYFSVIKQRGKSVITRMPDCPENIGCDLEGILTILRDKKKLVFKPSAGTHGDGFYALEYAEGKYLVNGEEKTEEELEAIFFGQKSFYVITSYIFMHPELKRIYPTSVNSIRIMVINKNGYDPKIMQTYMRIGSSKTGYTDNVGYGGICAMIDMDTGVMYDPETLRDHVYYPCPVHPDTGTEITGIQVPHWELVKEKVLEVCRSMPELEYLGFDVAVTEDGFNIMEINVHQDLHKVGKHSDEIRQFFREKIRYKERMYGIK